MCMMDILVIRLLFSGICLFWRLEGYLGGTLISRLSGIILEGSLNVWDPFVVFFSGGFVFVGCEGR